MEALLRAIFSEKLSSRSGEPTRVSEVDDEPNRADVGVNLGTLGRALAGGTASRDGCMSLGGTPVSEIVRATASCPLAIANAPDERIIIAALGASIIALRPVLRFVRALGLCCDTSVA